jgi:uncharacterized protein YqgV (UPF0045/DUF77 family)
LPEFSTQEATKWKFHAYSSKQTANSHCHVTMGQDLSEQLPPDVKFSKQTPTWQEVTVPMKTVDESDTQDVNEIVEQCHESGHMSEVTRQTVQILDASHEKANPSAITSKCTCLSKEERAALLKLPLCCRDLFDGTLGTWNGPETASETNKDAVP